MEETAKRLSEIQSLTLNEKSFSVERLHDLAVKLEEKFRADKKVAFVGNGGSAAEAMHLAAEFTGRCVINHRPLPALCLNESQSALTAIANDFGVESIFSRQVQAHLRSGDLLIALSTSGKSKNIISAMAAALEMGVEVVLWMGDFEEEFEGVDVWKVPSKSTPRIQEIHLMWGHVVAEIVELRL
jgi:D-sedoheptulose 7-phosphate isomerase